MIIKKEHFSIANGKERLFVVGGLIITYIFLVILVLFLFNALKERESLKLQTEAEKAFNTIFFELQDDPVRANSELAEYGIIGVGVYSNIGQNVVMLGNVPKVLPKKVISNFSSWGESNSSGTALYNPETGHIEYVRFINRLTILWDVIDKNILDLSDFSAPTMNFPDVLYIVLEGKAYNAKIMRMNFSITLVLAILTIIFFFIYHIYSANRGYRDTLEKQRSLVNLGQAARTLTHEIKNPLSSVNIQLAILRLKVDPKYKSNLEIIQSEMNRVKVLTDKVSEFLYNPTGVPVKIELKSFFIDLISRFGSDIKLYMDSDFSIFFDVDRARSVFENLIKNAIESGPNPQVMIIIRRGQKANTVKIEILDRGEGLPKDAKDKIYNPFFTTKASGSGIGLSISRQFVKARDGSLRLYPREGGGTVAEVVLTTKKNS